MSPLLIVTACAALITSAAHDPRSSTASLDELPLDDWIESAESLESLKLRYRMVNAEGKVRMLDVTLGGTERARFLLEKEGGGERQSVWIDNGKMTRLIELADQPSQSMVLDFASCVPEPNAWLEESADALGLDATSIPAPRVMFRVWPAEEAGSTWDLDMSCGVTRGSTFGWLERLRGSEHDAALTDDGYVVQLDGGARLLLDRSLGFIRRIDADPEDPAAGRIELLSVAIDEELDAAVFEAELPDDAQEIPNDTFLRPQEVGMWKLARFEWIRALRTGARKDESFLQDNRAGIEDCAARYYVTCFAPDVERVAESLTEAIDEQADRLLAAWETSRDQPGAREQFEKARTAILDSMKDACEKRAAVQAAALVVDPTNSDDPIVDELLEIEQVAATAALRDALFEPMRDHLNERLEEADRQEGRATRYRPAPEASTSSAVGS